jgi:hypothetical protein
VRRIPGGIGLADERTQRIGQNEVLFRAVNEQIRELDERFGETAPALEQFVCECGHGSCTERIEMTMEEYRRIRADPATFALVEGHQEPDVERVIERTDRFTVVRKREGEPAALAARHDPSGT